MINPMSGIIPPGLRVSLQQASTRVEEGKSDVFQNTLERAVADGEEAKLKDACTQFEGIMLQQMVKGLRSTVQKSDFFESSLARDIYEDMLYDSYSNAMASTHQVGLADILYRDLSRHIQKKPEASETGGQNGAKPPENAV